MKAYELIDHTADIGVRAFGRTLEELFRNAAIGMFEIIADLDSICTVESKMIQLTAQNVEDLYLSWHQELLFRSAVDRCVYKEFTFDTLSETELKATVRGERFHPERQSLKKEVKAVTYHELKVQKTGEGWIGEVIFDI